MGYRGLSAKKEAAGPGAGAPPGLLKGLGLEASSRPALPRAAQPSPHCKVLSAEGWPAEQEPGRQVCLAWPLPVEQPSELHPTPSVTPQPETSCPKQLAAE